jgi:hypothetical protein
MKGLNENWKAGLLLLVPLLYRTARKFLEESEEAGPFRKRRKVQDEDDQEAEKNRP